MKYYFIIIIMESIWKDLEICLEIEDCLEKEDCNNDIKCVHRSKFLSNGIEICSDCGEALYTLYEGCEWNNYKNDDGSYQNSTQRGDTFTSDNPYSKSGSIPGINKNSLMMRLHYQQTFSHKQKTFWKTSEKFSDYCSTLGLPTIVFSDSKQMWHVCMESGILTRASVRSGLIAACLYYSCVYNNIPVDRERIIYTLEICKKGFLKGEKVFMEIMNESSRFKFLGKEKLNIIENDSFVMYCNTLNLPFSMSSQCNDVYEKFKKHLDGVTPKSATAGILFYVVKNILKSKKPTKSKISQTVDVCIPTINKVLTILENNI